MNSRIARRTGPGFAFLLGVGVFVAALSANAQAIQHLTTTHPGGFPGLPVMTGIESTTNGVRLTWDGPSGYYQLYQKLGLSDQTWQKFASPNLNRTTNITALHANAFFKVAGPSPRYAGSAVCVECHEGIHQTETGTRHANAFTNPRFVAKGGQTNSSCLPCHTVGYGLPSGFVSKDDLNSNPRLAGVQCENCHGPAAAHAANEQDMVVRPRAELAGQLCGGCHNETSHRPMFEQWEDSGHFAVVEDMNPANRINSCGRCHSGSSRLALMKGENPSITVTNDANVGITCAVCHDPHAEHVWTNVLSGTISTNQLRYPFASTNDYDLTTSAPFANRYDINGCAQCHNQRGARWDGRRYGMSNGVYVLTTNVSFALPPHHSPQYNMLLGTAGELAPGLPPWRSSHGILIEKQCVGCHMAKQGDGSEAHPEFAGHTFRVESLNVCAECHGNPELLLTFATLAISSQIQTLKSSLDFWATTKAPVALRNKYGARAWEYTTPGELSSGGSGPSSSEQAQIPDNIKKARFNLYIVKYDGSFGVHNGPHAVSLLESARNWVQQELSK